MSNFDFLPWKEYRAFLNQAGAAAPVPTTVTNTLQIPTTSWTRQGVGNYRLTVPTLFRTNKCSWGITGDLLTVPGLTVGVARLSNNIIAVSSMNAGVAADDLLADASFWLMVFP